jgi:N-acetylated-alpha-linked acidic dipeptidase
MFIMTLSILAITLIAQSFITPLRVASQTLPQNWEEKFRALPRADLLKEYMRELSVEPHHLGSARDKQNAEWMRDKFKSWGLDATLEEYQVLFPTPRERVLELLAPTKFIATLKEPAIAEDPDSIDQNQLPTYNAYSADGDVTAPLVYVNYGIPADYEQLERMGVSVKGKIVIARYGASWRGIKPKVAYEHGAVGCLIYSDPKEDGYYQGDVYPNGPYRNETGVQRGSVMDMPIHPGDPLTPGVGATKDAKRIAREDAKTILKIPVLPISYGDALPLLKQLRGAVVPDAWRGALPITYHVGGNEDVKVHLKLSFNWTQATTYNVIARIAGSTYPDEWIIRGNHHDAWVNGADDPVSGMCSVLEEARAFGELLKQGWRPKRTMIFCAWDGEEQGLLGSTEWVEHHAEELKQKAVAYINTDSTGKGILGMSGSHTLERFINDVARAVPDPKGKGSAWEVVKAARERGANDEAKRELRERADLRIGALGSGSDYTAFIDHLGIASLNLGFSGEGGGGIYHSIYDSFHWYTKFSDGDFTHTRALAQVAGTAMMRLADADILPFEFTNFVDTVDRYIDEVTRLAATSKPTTPVDLKPLREAAEKLRRSADAYDRALRTTALSNQKIADSITLNRLLYQSERKLLSDAGLPRRDWFKHQIYAPGFYTGYGVKTLPGVREALEQKYWDEASTQARIISKSLEAMAVQIDAATKQLQVQK